MTALAAGGPASAAEPTSSSGRFSDTGLLDVARTAAGTPSKSSVNIGIPPPDELRVLEARREAELNRLSEKLRRAVSARAPQPTETLATPPWMTEVAASQDDNITVRSGLGASPSQNPGFAVEAAGRATILMVMAPASRRSRDAETGADPILCVDNGCYVSNGAQAPSTYHSFNQSLSLAGRIGRGAGECNHSTMCVFRNVEMIAGSAIVQPVNLRFVRHDRREQREVTIDTSCRVVENRLSCARPVRTSSYTLWVVPENVARDIGPEMLASALKSGLRTSQTAELPWNLQ